MTDPALHAGRLDRLRLRVRNPERMAAFYGEVLALEGSDASGGFALSPPAPDAPTSFRVHLTPDPDAVPAPRPSVGLYHFALLYPDRPALARAVAAVLDAGWERIDGASDHGVSEAFYLRDPEGNGVELYRDRPREAWPEDGDEVAMTTEPLDVDDLLTEATGVGRPGAPTLGHVHLHVSALEPARRFYVDVLGLRVRQSSYPGALFLAAGDYHHHLGLNTWARGRRPPEGAAGLLDYGWRMSARRIREIRTRAEEEGLDVESVDGGIALRDPDGTRVLLRPDPSP